ncbi:SusC/RagA family TonB-linked outer membrane protein [Flavobacterium limi]|uniref:SusC/RagA family TonB-linked outer membrane protein n=1 Tax=Flavobacterium limi TaxID=2045105 RepID=A0ABQ1UPL1_9FLAO|nr:SusC/RagA family TonB-linked outer membrane protein [Flavobacterium limi]GGF22330.1 SusC/RagA family TonB-linked outer membrane protein [Flavobacterium limi]
MKKRVRYYAIRLLLLIICFSPTLSSAQGKLIDGTIVDKDGLPIAGVNVLVKGSQRSAQSDYTGKFSIEANLGETLVISFIGMVTQQIMVTQAASINIILKDNPNELQEVVLVGYGSQKKGDLTGAVSRANLEPFREAPNVSIAQTLQGTVAGLNVGQVNSAGQNPSISVRGQTSLGGNSNVLVIVDGVNFPGGINNINPDDVATIDVLKDASSAAVYGAQGANGVILITTKKGGKNKAPQISFSTSYTTQTPTSNIRPLGRQAYLDKVKNLYWDKAYLAPEYTQPDPTFNLADYLYTTEVDSNGNIIEGDYDWWANGTKTGDIKDYKVSIAGGGNKVNYLLSASYTDQAGYIVNDLFKRTTVRANVGVDVTDWWNVSMQSFATFSDYSGEEPTLANIIRMPSLFSPYDDEGNIVSNPTGNNTLGNPFKTFAIDDYDKSTYLFANFSSDIKIPFVKGLSYKINFGNNYTTTGHYNSNIYGAGETGSAYKNNSTRYDYTFDNIVTYKKTIADDHDLDVTLLYGVTHRESESTSATGTGFTNLNLSYNSLELAAIQKTTSDGWDEALNYQMGRVNYKFRNKYIVTGTIRRDGFSGFAENNKWGVFPSVSLGWVISEEGFFKNINAVNSLKLRGGYGTIGNLTTRYFSLSTMSLYDAYVFGDGGSTSLGQTLNSLQQPDLKWEKTGGINLGVDFSLFKNRITGSVEYYNTKTTDQLFPQPIPAISGVNSINVNLGNIRNKGLEFTLTSKNIDTKDFKWSTTVNYSHNSNKILSLNGLDEDGDGKEDDITASDLFIGHSIGSIYGYEVGDIYQIGDVIPTGYSLGNRRIIDQDGDGTITQADRKILGKTDPDFRAGLLNTFTYKDFSLNIFFNTVQGGKNSYLSANEPTYGGRRDENAQVFNFLNNTDFWSPINPDGVNPSYINAPAVSANKLYARNFVRLQDISFSYNLPKEILKNLGVSSLQLYLSGKNLATWTKWRGWDPETGNGLADNGRPVLKGYSLGLNVTF